MDSHRNKGQEEPTYQEFPSAPVAKTLCSQFRDPGSNPWSGNQIPHGRTKSSHAETKDLTCRNEG